EGKKVGGLGDIGCFSFYANKIITTGEGGMLTLNDAGLADRARSLKSLAFGSERKFMHSAIGYNYRMTNLQAALGCAQLERIEAIIERKRALARFYTSRFCDLASLQLLVPDLPLERWPAMDKYAHRLHDWLESSGPGFEVRLAAYIGDLTREARNGRRSGATPKWWAREVDPARIVLPGPLVGPQRYAA